MICARNVPKRRDVVGRARMEVSQGDRGGKIVAELDKVCKSFLGRTVVQDFSGTIMRGDKVGLIGPNGAGKTTLLKMILGELAPDGGSGEARCHSGTWPTSIRCETTSTSTQLWPTSSAQAASGSKSAARAKHVMGYLQDFLLARAC